MNISQTDEFYMRKALQLAQEAYEQNEVPVGAVLVLGNKVIGLGHNQCEKLNDSTAHAEMIAITAGQNYLGSKVLNECTLYVTVEPCIMCAGAMYWCQLGRLVYGASDNKKGYSTVNHNILHPKTVINKNLLQSECSLLMNDFFRSLRN